jgi:OmpA-OmpF porin, OOP family
MRKLSLLLLAIPFLSAVVAAEQKDATGCKDHPLFTRMPGSWIHHCSEKTFDAHAFPVGKGKVENLEGRKWVISYYPQADLKEKPSELQIDRNFENAVAKLGGTVVATDRSRRTFRLVQGGREFWIDLTAEFTGKYGLTIVEREAMKQDVVADAAAFSNDIRATGHVAVYGIYFDSGKADIKPESAQAIAEIAKLLQMDANLKLFVVGHTDSQGTVDGNLKLSQDRAAAVLQALVTTHGVAAVRLRAFGCGQLAPVAANDTEEGRAKNRRVELVKQ